MALNAVPCCPVVKNDITYFPIKMRVYSNPSYRDDFLDKNLTKDEFIKLCTYKGGGGIYVDIATKSNTAVSSCRELIKFYDVLECIDSIQFWGILCSSRLPKIKTALGKITTIESLIPHIMRLLQEYHGDQAAALLLPGQTRNI